MSPKKYLASVLAALIAVLALTGAATGLAAVTSKPKSMSAQVASLQRQVTALKASNVSLSTQASNLRVCLPQLQQEVSGLNITTEWSGMDHWLTSAYLNNPTIISSNCQHVLNGASSGSGE